MISKRIWEVLFFVVILALAAKLVFTMVAPLVPYIIAGGVVAVIAGKVYHRNRHW